MHDKLQVVQPLSEALLIAHLFTDGPLLLFCLDGILQGVAALRPHILLAKSACTASRVLPWHAGDEQLSSLSVQWAGPCLSMQGAAGSPLSDFGELPTLQPTYPLCVECLHQVKVPIQRAYVFPWQRACSLRKWLALG